MRRPRVGEDSPTIGLDATELNRLLAAAERDSPRSAALIALEVHAGRVRAIRMLEGELERTALLVAPIFIAIVAPRGTAIQ